MPYKNPQKNIIVAILKGGKKFKKWLNIAVKRTDVFLPLTFSKQANRLILKQLFPSSWQSSNQGFF
jgi:hypothetical protein